MSLTVRTLLFAVATLPILFLSPLSYLILNVLVGHSHAVLGYMAQYRAGKWNRVRTALFVGLIVALSFVAVDQVYWPLLEAVSGVFFVFHHFDDEQLFFDIKNIKFWRPLVASLGLSPLFFNALPHYISRSWELTVYSSVICIIPLICFIALKKERAYWLHMLVWFAILLSNRGFQLFLPNLGAALALYHYYQWYAYSYDRHKVKDTFYIQRTVLVNALVFALGFWWLSSRNNALSYFFSAGYFYSWIIVHVIFSYYTSDFKMWRQELLTFSKAAKPTNS